MRNETQVAESPCVVNGSGKNRTAVADVRSEVEKARGFSPSSYVSSMMLRSGAFSAVRGAGLHTLEHVSRLSVRQLASIDGVGMASANALAVAVEAAGLKMAGDEADLSEVGERIRDLRIDSNLSIADLSEMASVSRGKLSRCEKGQGALKDEELSRISGAFGLSRAELVEV